MKVEGAKEGGCDAGVYTLSMESLLGERPRRSQWNQFAKEALSWEREEQACIEDGMKDRGCARRSCRLCTFGSLSDLPDLRSCYLKLRHCLSSLR